MYLARVRRTARRFAEQGPTDLPAALQGLRGAAHFDVEVPTKSTRRDLELVKTGVKRLSSWYMRYLSAQLESFAGGVTRLAESLVQASHALESENDELDVRLRSVEQRLARLESQSPGTTGPAPATKQPVPAGGEAKAAAVPAQAGRSRATKRAAPKQTR